MNLIHASSAMARDRDRATYEAWGGVLPLDRYLAEEWRLRCHPWSREAASAWFLRSDEGEVLCSCETYRMTSFLDDGGLVAGHTYGVASVYTEPGKRRKGYTTELLSRLADHLKGGDANAQAMILYSDVALEIYRRAGFEPRPGLNLAFDSIPGDPGEGVDELIPEHRAAQALAAIPRSREPFLVWPVAGQIDWHLERERIFAELLARPRPVACGARAGGSTALWAADYREGQLTVLLSHLGAPAEAEALLLCARRTAHAAQLARTVLWKTPQDGPLTQARREDRLDHLDSVPMIRSLDPRVQAAGWNWIPRAVWV